MDVAEIGLGDTPAAQINEHQPAVLGQQFELLRDVGSADDIEDHVDAAPFREIARDIQEILVAIVDRARRAEPRHGGAFLLGARGRQHGRADCPGHLDGGDADAACAALDQDRFARL